MFFKPKILIFCACKVHTSSWSCLQTKLRPHRGREGEESPATVLLTIDKNRSNQLQDNELRTRGKVSMVMLLVWKAK
jgi:hypothetical protein